MFHDTTNCLRGTITIAMGHRPPCGVLMLPCVCSISGLELCDSRSRHSKMGKRADSSTQKKHRKKPGQNDPRPRVSCAQATAAINWRGIEHCPQCGVGEEYCCALKMPVSCGQAWWDRCGWMCGCWSYGVIESHTAAQRCQRRDSILRDLQLLQ